MASASAPHESDQDDSDQDDSGQDRRSPRRRRLPAVQVVRRGVAQLVEITGRESDTVSGIEPTEDGWILQVELVELERIPASTSVLASYEAELDDQGDLLEYRRVRRYFRNQADGSE